MLLLHLRCTLMKRISALTVHAALNNPQATGATPPNAVNVPKDLHPTVAGILVRINGIVSTFTPANHPSSSETLLLHLMARTGIALIVEPLTAQLSQFLLVSDQTGWQGPIFIECRNDSTR